MSGSIGRFRDGFLFALRGLGVLAGARSLWPLASAPLALALLALGGAIWALVHFAPDVFAWSAENIPALEAARWWEWLWVGPALALRAVARALLFAAFCAAAIVGALLLANTAASPFLEALSERVERVVRREDPPDAGSWRDLARSLVEEVKRTAAFAGAQLALAVGGFVVPLLAPVAAAASFALTLHFLPLDYSAYALERRGVLRFRDKRAWLVAHRPLVLGFGVAAFALTVVPGLNLLAMPVLVTGGTLLVLETEASAAIVGARGEA